MLFSVGIGGSALSMFTQFLQIDHSTSWWTILEVNWLTLCQERRREVFSARYCTPVYL